MRILDRIFLSPSPSAPLLTIIGLLIVLAVTACTSSSAATQPSETENIPPSSSSMSQLSNQPTSELPTQAAPQPSETATAVPTPRPTDTPTPTTTPSPTPTTIPTPSLRQLTAGGCCVQPSFDPDGEQVLFIDKPSEEEPVGIYGIDIGASQNLGQSRGDSGGHPPPTLVNTTIGFRSPDRTIVASMAGNLARFTNEMSAASWTVDTGGNWPRFSPDSSQILWVATDREGPYDRRQSDIWLANLDGSDHQLLLSLYGGGFAGWFPNGQRILLLGRDNPADEEQTLIVYNLANGRRTDLFSHKRLRGADISPSGSWIAFFLTFSDEPADDGLWVINTEGAIRQKLEVPGFGAYRWRDDNTLLYIPMRVSADESMQLWAVDVATNQSWPLTDPTSHSFSISNGDWDVSPDGQHLVFVNSQDQNIWLITLP
jgi:Tol biopolymer transport system component